MADLPHAHTGFPVVFGLDLSRPDRELVFATNAAIAASMNFASSSSSLPTNVSRTSRKRPAKPPPINKISKAHGKKKKDHPISTNAGKKKALHHPSKRTFIEADSDAEMPDRDDDVEMSDPSCDEPLPDANPVKVRGPKKNSHGRNWFITNFDLTAEFHAFVTKHLPLVKY